jgi:hypothetical protein
MTQKIVRMCEGDFLVKSVFANIYYNGSLQLFTFF